MFSFTAPEKPRIKTSSYKGSYLVNNVPIPLNVNIGFDLRILAYRKLTILCSAAGFPTPELSWEKNGEPIGTDENIVITKNGPRGKLVFQNLVPAQNGVYACVASNAAGYDRKRTTVISRSKCWNSGNNSSLRNSISLVRVKYMYQ